MNSKDEVKETLNNSSSRSTGPFLKCRDVLVRYAKAGIYCLCIGLLTLFLAEWLNQHLTIPHQRLQLLRLFGIIPGAMGIYGASGWNIQTLDGNTPPEKLNRRLSMSLPFIGYVLTILTLSLTEG